MTTVNHRSMSGALGSMFGVISTTAHATAQAVEISASALDVLEQKTIAWRATAKHETDRTLAVLEDTAEDEIIMAVAQRRTEILSELEGDKKLSEMFLKVKAEREAKKKKKGE